MTITATELKENLGYYLELASKEEIVVTKNGRPAAKLVSPFAEKVMVLDSLIGVLSGDGAEEDVKEARWQRINEKHGL